MPNAKPLPHHARIALVLGGGGLKGFAHIGVLRALEERGIQPSHFAGSSIGALVAAAYVTGTTVPELTAHARKLRRRDLFRVNHVGMLLDRMKSQAIYLEEPLRALTRSVVAHVRFDELATPLFVNTVDVERGTQVVWGLPAHRDVHVDDAVYASCALPGFFPPGRVDGRICIDGGTIDNLPVSIVAPHVDAVIAVDVGNSDITREENIASAGFASISMRAAMVMAHSHQAAPLRQWSGPPMILIRPRVAHYGWFRFGVTDEMIELGYRAAVEALGDLDACLTATSGIYPRRFLHLAVDRAKCNGCGLCAAIAPAEMALDLEGKAFARNEEVVWSPADGEFVRHCPTGAISAGQSAPALDKAS
jgi:NTE family protein